ncbi:hypothetical protein SCP_0606810 [Sparassis crispa]|uniref:DUF6589 domain-containing protein n=1 Tax=Sparassis crispa TaxID=139825 RepID=A0A401GR19_9APHY|nr:hypothetical protein SCP_0606810 [Sparassis crispa]GBE84701.1 hypothetical protein SCP_0606810 [Sparassis crispa]
MDNVQKYVRRRDARIGHGNYMKIGLTATVAEAVDFDPAVGDIDDKRARIAQNLRAELTVEKLLGMIDIAHFRKVGTLQWLHTLVTYIPQLAKYQSAVAKLYKTDGAKLCLPSKQKTIMHPLATVAKNENIMTELRDALVDFLGDEFRSFEIIQPFLELWHTEWTHLSLTYEAHWGSLLTPDPSKLGHSASKINQKAPANLKKVNYYPAAYTSYLVLDVRMLDCWRILLETDDILEHFAALDRDGQLPLLDELQAKVEILY